MRPARVGVGRRPLTRAMGGNEPEAGVAPPGRRGWPLARLAWLGMALLSLLSTGFWVSDTEAHLHPRTYAWHHTIYENDPTNYEWHRLVARDIAGQNAPTYMSFYTQRVSLFFMWPCTSGRTYHPEGTNVRCSNPMPTGWNSSDWYINLRNSPSGLDYETLDRETITLANGDRAKRIAESGFITVFNGFGGFDLIPQFFTVYLTVFNVHEPATFRLSLAELSQQFPDHELTAYRTRLSVDLPRLTSLLEFDEMSDEQGMVINDLPRGITMSQHAGGGGYWLNMVPTEPDSFRGAEVVITDESVTEREFGVTVSLSFSYTLFFNLYISDPYTAHFTPVSQFYEGSFSSPEPVGVAFTPVETSLFADARFGTVLGPDGRTSVVIKPGSTFEYDQPWDRFFTISVGYGTVTTSLTVSFLERDPVVASLLPEVTFEMLQTLVIPDGLFRFEDANQPSSRSTLVQGLPAHMVASTVNGTLLITGHAASLGTVEVTLVAQEVNATGTYTERMLATIALRGGFTLRHAPRELVEGNYPFATYTGFEQVIA